MPILFFKNQIEDDGYWHLYNKGETRCLCGAPVTGKNNWKIKIEKRDLCYVCHSKAHELANEGEDVQTSTEICESGIR